MSKTPIIGKSEQIAAIRSLIGTIAPSHSTVLITGESGTGKELVAQALHLSSPRAQGPFVPINCGAIPRELIESELFGHRKGAFTGAVADRPGRFEMARGGTLFLDEIGDLPLDMQVKLLRVLQERCVEPVGSGKSIPIDVRVVAATHKNLEAEIAAGRFREDLYYRINVLPICTAALRERPDDVVELLHFYAARHALPGQPPIRFESPLMDLLKAYRWPGNVRELSNLVDRFTTLFPARCIGLEAIPDSMLPSGLSALRTERAALKSKAPASVKSATQTASALDVLLFPTDRDSAPTLTCLSPSNESFNASALQSPEALDDYTNSEPMSDVEEIVRLAQGMSLPPEGISLKQRLTDIERTLIEQALERSNGNVSQTARLLNLQRTTLIEKINKYQLRMAG